MIHRRNRGIGTVLQHAKEFFIFSGGRMVKVIRELPDLIIVLLP
jgi:hypothetical protein